uniref:Uncharacterized protein n=1 Tax=Anguilla anguilla TaxID=7936 RepID=A0A0E9W9U2_ANGAN
MGLTIITRHLLPLDHLKSVTFL